MFRNQIHLYEEDNEHMLHKLWGGAVCHPDTGTDTEITKGVHSWKKIGYNRGRGTQKPV